MRLAIVKIIHSIILDIIMGQLPISSQELRSAVIRFDGALLRLEQSLNEALDKLKSIDVAQNTQVPNSTDGKDDLILREELASAKKRERELETAVNTARAALGEAIDDIRLVLGSV